MQTFERKYLEQLGKKVPAVKKHQDAVYEILKREVRRSHSLYDEPAEALRLTRLSGMARSPRACRSSN